MKYQREDQNYWDERRRLTDLPEDGTAESSILSIIVQRRKYSISRKTSRKGVCPLVPGILPNCELKPTELKESFNEEGGSWWHLHPELDTALKEVLEPGDTQSHDGGSWWPPKVEWGGGPGGLHWLAVSAEDSVPCRSKLLVGSHFGPGPDKPRTRTAAAFSQQLLAGRQSCGNCLDCRSWMRLAPGRPAEVVCSSSTRPWLPCWATASGFECWLHRLSAGVDPSFLLEVDPSFLFPFLVCFILFVFHCLKSVWVWFLTSLWVGFSSVTPFISPSSLFLQSSAPLSQVGRIHLCSTLLGISFSFCSSLFSSYSILNFNPEGKIDTLWTYILHVIIKSVPHLVI